MAVTVTDKRYRTQGLGLAVASKIVFDSGSTVATLKNQPIDKLLVQATALDAATTVTLADSGSDVTVTVNANDTVYVNVVGI